MTDTEVDTESVTIAVGDVVKIVGDNPPESGVPLNGRYIGRTGTVTATDGSTVPYLVNIPDDGNPWAANVERLGHMPVPDERIIVDRWMQDRGFATGVAYNVTRVNDTTIAGGYVVVRVPEFGDGYFATKWRRLEEPAPGAEPVAEPTPEPVTTPSVVEGDWIRMKSTRNTSGEEVYVHEDVHGQIGRVNHYTTGASLPVNASFLGKNGQVHIQNIADYEKLVHTNPFDTALKADEEVYLAGPHVFGTRTYTTEAGIGSRARVSRDTDPGDGTIVPVRWVEHSSRLREPGSTSNVNRSALAKAEHVVTVAPRGARVQAVEFLPGASEGYKQARWGKKGTVVSLEDNSRRSVVRWDDAELNDGEIQTATRWVLLDGPRGEADFTPGEVPPNWTEIIRQAQADIHQEACDRNWCQEYEAGFERMFGMEVSREDQEKEWEVSVTLSREVDVTDHLSTGVVFGDAAAYQTLDADDEDVTFRTCVSFTMSNAGEPNTDDINDYLVDHGYSFDNFEVDETEEM